MSVYLPSLLPPSGLLLLCSLGKRTHFLFCFFPFFFYGPCLLAILCIFPSIPLFYYFAWSPCFFSCFFDDLRVVPGSSIHFIFNKERIYKKKGKKLSKNAIIRLGNNNERDKKAGDKREGALELCYRSRGRESSRERER